MSNFPSGGKDDVLFRLKERENYLEIIPVVKLDSCDRNEKIRTPWTFNEKNQLLYKFWCSSKECNDHKIYANLFDLDNIN